MENLHAVLISLTIPAITWGITAARVIKRTKKKTINPSHVKLYTEGEDEVQEIINRSNALHRRNSPISINYSGSVFDILSEDEFVLMETSCNE